MRKIERSAFDSGVDADISGSIHIVTAADDRYIPHTAAMLHSLFSANPCLTFHIHFLHREVLDRKLIGFLDNLCASHGADFNSISVASYLTINFPISSSYPEEAWYRLRLPSLIPVIKKVLWLDSDVIVLESIEALWNVNISDKPLAAVKNALFKHRWDLPKSLGMMSPRQYFNTGVMLLNLDLLRKEDAENQFNNATNKYREVIRFADQDVLNALYHERFLPLDLRWNFITSAYYNLSESIAVHGEAGYSRARYRPSIVHFTTMKPWVYGCGHPYRDTYLKHRLEAGWPSPSRESISLPKIINRRIPIELRVLLGRIRRRQFLDLWTLVKLWLQSNRNST